MGRQKKKVRTKAGLHDASKPSVVVGTKVDDAGFVTVTVTSPLGKIRYRVPVEPLPVPATTH